MSCAGYFGSNHFSQDHLASHHFKGICTGCGGYFGSGQFRSYHFRSNHFATVCAPIPPPPVPVPSGSSGSAGGGGFISGAPLAPYLPCDMERDLFGKLRIKCRPELATAFAKAVAKKIQNEIERETRNAPADPLSVPRTIPPQKVREADLRRLREKIRQLEAEIAKTAGVHSAEAEALRATIEDLRRVVEDLQEKVEFLRTPRINVKYRTGLNAKARKETEIETEAQMQDVLEGAELDAMISSKIKAAMLASMGAPPVPVRTPTILSKDRLAGVWKLVGAAGLYFSVDKVSETPWVRSTGRGLAVALGLSGLVDILGVEREGTN